MLRLNDFISAINSSFERAPMGRLPVELFSLTRSLGGVSFARGSIIEVDGDTGTGKTSFALTLSANITDDTFVLWIDTERAFDPDYAVKLGVDLSKIVLWRSPSMNTLLEFFENILPYYEDVFSLIVIDSASGLISEAEFNNSLISFQGSHQYDCVTEFICKVSSAIAMRPYSVLFINQDRYSKKKVQASYSAAFTAYSRYRIRMSKRDVTLGVMLDGYVYTNKDAFHAKPNQQFSVLVSNQGSLVNKAYDVYQEALQFNLIEKSGSWYREPFTQTKGLGIEAFLNELIQTDCLAYLLDCIRNGGYYVQSKSL